MSIRLIAKALYAARQREAAVEKELTNASMAERPRLVQALHRARTERKRLEATLAGHIDRGPIHR